MPKTQYTITAPGRICLFGEHQDYLGLPVIAAAISRELQLAIDLENHDDNGYVIRMPDLGSEERIDPTPPIAYENDHDFLRASVKVLLDEGVKLPQALTATIRSTIPIASGTSSSSAMINAWIAALLYAAGHPMALDPLTVVKLAHRAEVIEFNHSGGMMDHLSIAFGNIRHFDFAKDNPTSPLPALPKGWVLGDSRQPKATQAVLSRVRTMSETAMKKAGEFIPEFDLQTTPIEEVRNADLSSLDEAERVALLGQLRNRDILIEGHALLKKENVDAERLGALLYEHHGLLRDAMGISTERVEAMLAAAMDAGALGGKINGSGGGGCLFVLAPGREEKVVEAMTKAGGQAWPIEISAGIRLS